ncbi:Protein of unknown function [Gryllus bimaculatus]|nr:Protein of unknown function [Gryllus bimaculatus]
MFCSAFMGHEFVLNFNYMNIFCVNKSIQELNNIAKLGFYFVWLLKIIKTFKFLKMRKSIFIHLFLL